MANHRETDKYKKHLRTMIDNSTIAELDPEIGTYRYVCDNYEGNYLRVLNKDENKVHIIDKDKFEARLKFYNETFETFFKEIERINFTIWF